MHLSKQIPWRPMPWRPMPWRQIVRLVSYCSPLKHNHQILVPGSFEHLILSQATQKTCFPYTERSKDWPHPSSEVSCLPFSHDHVESYSKTCKSHATTACSLTDNKQWRPYNSHKYVWVGTPGPIPPPWVFIPHTQSFTTPQPKFAANTPNRPTQHPMMPTQPGVQLLGSWGIDLASSHAL